MAKISEECRKNFTRCTPHEIAQIAVRETLIIADDIRKDVEKTVGDKVIFTVILFIGIVLGILFEEFIIPINPVTGFWGLVVILVSLIGFLVWFTIFRAIFRRLTRGK